MTTIAEIDPDRLLDVLWRMPFGKYQGRALVDLPEPYLVWFSQKGFPGGKLGEAMELALVIRTNGLEDLIEPLRDGDPAISPRG